MSDTRSRRLQKELGMARREKEYVKEVTLVDGDVGKWQVLLNSRSMPDYMGPVTLNITFPSDYPFKPPSIYIPSIYHPNVYPSGKLCISTLDEGKPLPGGGSMMITWRPSLSLTNILIGVTHLLEDPNPYSPANVEASKMFLKDKQGYEAKNREWKISREERLVREKILLEQNLDFAEALASDQRKENMGEEAQAVPEAIKEDFEEELLEESHCQVTQPIQTRLGREMFKFDASGPGDGEPSVGDLRRALKRKRPEFGEIQLRVKKVNKFEVLEDGEKLSSVSTDVILVDNP